MMVLMAFPCYNLSTIQDIPYCHFTVLFTMAENINSMNALTILTAEHAKYDRDTRESLYQVERDKFKSKGAYRSVVTEDAKKEAEKYAKQ